jgi:hypothetical protein
MDTHLVTGFDDRSGLDCGATGEQQSCDGDAHGARGTIESSVTHLGFLLSK